MSDYRVDIKVRNNNILDRIEAAGYESIPKFCKAHGISYPGLLDLVNMQRLVIDERGEFTDFVYQVSDALVCAPQDLFSEAQMNAFIESNKRTMKVDEAEMLLLLENQNEEVFIEDLAANEELPRMTEKALEGLTFREQKVLRMRFGIDMDREYTLEEVGQQFGVTRTRIRDIELKALRKLRHPSRSDPLSIFVDPNWKPKKVGEE